MNEVEPIRDLEKVEEMKNELLKDSYRNYMLFVIGINTGLRISDILRLKVKHFKNKTHLRIKEQKNNRKRKIRINNRLREDIEKYIINMNDDDFLFQSRQGGKKPISRVQAYRILRKAADKCNLEDTKIGTHSLRKTFGYHHYQRNKDIAILQKLFNHSAPSITRRYIGLSQDELDSAMDNFYL